MPRTLAVLPSTTQALMRKGEVPLWRRPAKSTQTATCTCDAKEYQRLCDQARMWQGATAEVLHRVGLGLGMSCLDVGCGPGAVMRLMADRVGAEGRVVGGSSTAGAIRGGRARHPRRNRRSGPLS